MLSQKESWSEALDPHDLFIIPATIAAGMDPAEIDFEWEQMLQRSQATDSFLKGDLSARDYLVYLHDQGVDCDQFVADVETDCDGLFQQ
jgi:hypothetical protein